MERVQDGEESGSGVSGLGSSGQGDSGSGSDRSSILTSVFSVNP